MKTALCLSGMVRTFERCLPSLRQNIIDVIQPDVFCCSHEYNELVQSELKPKAYLIADYSLPIHLYDENEFISRLNPQIITHKGANNMVLSLYKQLMLSELLKQYPDYDYIVFARFDLEYRQNINFLPNNGISIPAGNDFLDGINDQIAWGDRNNMLFYMNRMKYFNTYVLNGYPIHPETILRVHLQSQNILPFRVGFDYSIMR